MSRRDVLLGLAAGLLWPVFATAGTPSSASVRLAAAWRQGQADRVGVLEAATHGTLAIAASLEVPTRAHGLLREPSGTLLAVARRPGDWLLRWDVSGRAIAWRWIEPGRAFAGHLLASADGATVYTTEIDLETGAGLIGVRAGATLAKRDEWPSHGLDPHQLLWDATRPGALIVANGGVPTRPETGRIKHDLERMDSSLVRLDGTGRRRLGQWRLGDPRLSLRHLAWNGTRLGIALQAEHDDPAVRQEAPVLAIFEDDTLRSVSAPGMAGYAGSIAAHGDGFAVSCPRHHGIAFYDAHSYQDFIPLPEACPLVSASRLWAGGRVQSLGIDDQAKRAEVAVHAGLPDIRLDNHWIAV